MRIAIFLFDGVTALDAVGPYESLQRLPGSDIVFVAETAGPVRTGDRFLALHADAALTDIATADLLLVPGGHPCGLTRCMNSAPVAAWISRIDATTRWTASVCTGSLILAAAGVLAGRKASTHWRARKALAALGVDYSPARVTVDGKYATSAGVAAGLDLGLNLCAEIGGAEAARTIEIGMHMKPQPAYRPPKGGAGDAADREPDAQSGGWSA